MAFTYINRAAERDIGSPSETKNLIRASIDLAGAGTKIIVTGIQLTKVKELYLTADSADVVELKEQGGQSFGKYNIGVGAPVLLFGNKDFPFETTTKGNNIEAVVTTGTNLRGHVIYYDDNN